MSPQDRHEPLEDALDDALARALRLVRADDARRAASPRVEAELMAAWDARRVARLAATGRVATSASHGRRSSADRSSAAPHRSLRSISPSRRFAAWRWQLASVALTAACLALATRHVEESSSTRAGGVLDAPTGAVLDSALFPTDPSLVLEDEAMEVVRVRVNRRALPLLGVDASTNGPSFDEEDTVEFEVLVGEDGVARGMRRAVSTTGYR